MKLSSHSRAGLFVISTLGALWAAGCSDDDGPNGLNGLGGGDFGGASGATTAGGATNQGGTVGQGGLAVGGATNVGGSGTATTGGSTMTVGGSSSVGGAATGGATTAGAAGSTAVCGTTKGSFQFFSTTATTTSTLPLGGFNKASAATNTNANSVVDIVTAPATLCSGGCLRMSGTFAAGDPTFNKTVTVEKALTGDYTNLLGAKVVVTLAIEGLVSTIPISLGLFAPGSNGAWGAVGKGNAQLTSHNGTFAEFVWDVADMKDYMQRQYCAASVSAVGIMLQTGGTAPTTSGTVTVYIKSIEIRPAGYVPQGAGGGPSVGGSAGAAGMLTAGNAGTAGSQ